ncbi:MAG: glucosamine-6-phosphate deaminase [Gemmatimonadota bacterium]
MSVQTYATVEQLGAAAADFVEARLRSTISAKGKAHLVLATGASQLTFLNSLKERDVAWDAITVFHLDEYTGLSEDHPASFRRYLRERILDEVRPAEVHLIDASAADLNAEIRRYEGLLKSHPLDVACIGIGENGHIAFNDPPVADFDDARLVKEVELDHACRMQQVNEGWFPSLEETPPRAVTLTIPAVMSSGVISCVVPGERKAEAVDRALNGPISPACPASILRRHNDTTLFLDRSSAARI